MSEPRRGSPAAAWRPSPLTFVAAALAGWCAILCWIGLHRQVMGNDPAGNGMASALLHGLAETGLELTAFLLGLYLLCRWKPIRYACAGLLALLGLGLMLLVR